MSVKRDELPSAEVNPGNSLARVQECQKYMTLQLWTQFNFLYAHLAQFQEMRVRGAGKMFRDDDEFTKAWNNLRASSVDSMLKNLESANDFDTFMIWIKRLADITQDPKSLWNILHTEVQCSLKVTHEQAQQIQSAFFTPEMLFEFGLESFLKSNLCDLSEPKDEEGLIDVFYACSGYIRACGLPESYQIKQQEFIDLIQKVLVAFTDIPDFDAHRLVWLVENMKDHLHLGADVFINICKNVLESFSNKTSSSISSINRLHKMCIISTSPFLQELPIIRSAINKVFASVINEQHLFARKYLFGSFVTCLWEDEERRRVSDPLAAWMLYLDNLSKKIKEKEELPDLLIIDFIDDSLQYFFGYYGEVQPSISRAPDLRRDIFAIVDTVVKYYPGELPEDKLNRIWFLLTIAAVCGADEADLERVKQLDCNERHQPYLGLKHTATDFEDYPLALGRLMKKFEGELESFPIMVNFIRKKFNPHAELEDGGDADNVVKEE